LKARKLRRAKAGILGRSTADIKAAPMRIVRPQATFSADQAPRFACIRSSLLAGSASNAVIEKSPTAPAILMAKYSKYRAPFVTSGHRTIHWTTPVRATTVTPVHLMTAYRRITE
jgi:hypothetical protein